MNLMKQKKSDDAVSPVIGVMLMLVITVVIAAVITVFATGILGGDSDTTPMVMIEAGIPITQDRTSYDWMTGEEHTYGLLTGIDYIHKGGDSLLLEYIEIALVGSTQTITNYFPGMYGVVTVSGQSGTGVTAEAGDIIRLTITSPSNLNTDYKSGEKIVWTMYDTRTNGVLASGDFVVP